MTAVPAWGSPAVPVMEREFIVIGAYLENGQRFRFTVLARSAYEAEKLVTTGDFRTPPVADPAGNPVACGVVTLDDDGDIITADAEYAYYLDPDKPWPMD